MTRRRLAGLLVPFALLAAACGGSDASSAADGADVQPANPAVVGIDHDATTQVSPVTVTGEVLPTDDGTGLALGLVAPTIEGQGFDDAKVTIGPDGTAKVVYFLAHWCPHCQEELPLVQQLVNSGRVPDGVEIIAVSTAVTSERPNFPASAWFEDEAFSGVIMRDNEVSEALIAMGGSGFPFAIALDGENRVLGRVGGQQSEEQMLAFWQLAAGG